MPKHTISIMVMSGADDGALFRYNSDDHGQITSDNWSLHIGRREESDLTIRNDTFVSRDHAQILFRSHQWWLEDRKSTNGTFIERPENFFDDQRLAPHELIPLRPNQLFRVGRTWLRIQQEE